MVLHRRRCAVYIPRLCSGFVFLTIFSAHKIYLSKTRLPCIMFLETPKLGHHDSVLLLSTPTSPCLLSKREWSIRMHGVFWVPGTLKHITEGNCGSRFCPRCSMGYRNVPPLLLPFMAQLEKWTRRRNWDMGFRKRLSRHRYGFCSVLVVDN
jgi:hypothetical protein